MAREHDQRQQQARDAVDLEVDPRAAEDLAVVEADADQQRMAADLAERDQPRFAGGRVRVLERRG